MAKKKNTDLQKESGGWQEWATMSLPYAVALLFFAQVPISAYQLIATVFRLDQYKEVDEAQIVIWIPILKGVFFVFATLVILMVTSRLSDRVDAASSAGKRALLSIIMGAVVALAAFGGLWLLPKEWIGPGGRPVIAGALWGIQCVIAYIAGSTLAKSA